MNNVQPNQSYTALQGAYVLFNKTLFGDTLPACLITMQRQAGSFGYFSYEAMEARNGGAVVNEIALNPSKFQGRSDIEILSTLVHEMCHLKTYIDKSNGRAGYHNQVWADLMESIGLMPSHTGKQGGKKVGQRMTHYIIQGGLFEFVASNFLAGTTTSLYQDRVVSVAAVKTVKAKLKVKYTCMTCRLNVWGKTALLLKCHIDDELLVEN